MKIKLEDHPKLKMAHTLVTKYPDAIIAGGVARDILLGVEYNDIDIFIPSPLTYSASESLHGDIRAMAGCIVHKDTYTGQGVRYIVGDLDICILPRAKMTSIEGLVESFDMVMSQAWLAPIKDGFHVHCTDLFTEMQHRKVIGYYPDLVLDSSAHVVRIVERFGDDHLVIAFSNPNKGGANLFPFRMIEEKNSIPF